MACSRQCPTKPSNRCDHVTERSTVGEVFARRARDRIVRHESLERSDDDDRLPEGSGSAREIARQIAGLDLGQTVVIRDRACVAGAPRMVSKISHGSWYANRTVKDSLKFQMLNPYNANFALQQTESRRIDQK